MLKITFRNRGNSIFAIKNVLAHLFKVFFTNFTFNGGLKRNGSCTV